MRIFEFSKLEDSDLIIDAIYEGGQMGNAADDPINKILKVGNQGGFRYSGSIEQLRYIVLYTSGENLDWPDSIDQETGLFKYYGDNRMPGHELHDTSKKGNLILMNLFESLHSVVAPRQKIPPIFIFEKYPTDKSNRAVQFKGLCVPGTLQKDSTENLIAIWKTSNGQRFQNYEAYFTILDIALIPRNWICDLNANNVNSQYAPKPYKEWMNKGKYKPLISRKTVSIRSQKEQMPNNNHENELLAIIYQYFKDSPTSFEHLAVEIYRMTNQNILIDEITRPTRDGGHDAIGRLKLGLDKDPIFVEFALEAKCYNPGINSIGVKETSRLISRIRNRQYGILVTTSFISTQAYEEVRADRHPIIFISGGDIIKILIERGINTVKSLTNYLINNFQLKKS